jgi:hypothetical protein
MAINYYKKKDDELKDKNTANPWQVSVYGLGFEKQEDLVLDFQVGKGQLGSAILILRRRHQLVDILLQMNLHGKITKEQKQGSHRQPVDGAMVAEEGEQSDEKRRHKQVLLHKDF